MDEGRCFDFGAWIVGDVGHWCGVEVVSVWCPLRKEPGLRSPSRETGTWQVPLLDSCAAIPVRLDERAGDFVEGFGCIFRTAIGAGQYAEAFLWG